MDDLKIPVGSYAEVVLGWIRSFGTWFFDGLAVIFQVVSTNIQWVLQTPHPLIVIVVVAVLVWLLQRSRVAAVIAAVGLLFVYNQGYWSLAMASLALVAAATITCMAIGVPLGIIAATNTRVRAILMPIVEFMEMLPLAVFLVPAVVLFAKGPVAGLFAMILFVLPVPIRLAYSGTSSTPGHLRDVADCLGASPVQRLIKVELPFAMPQIMQGLNKTAMLSFSMVIIAALIGARGIGLPLVRALEDNNLVGALEVGIVIIVLAVVVDRMLRARRS